MATAKDQIAVQTSAAESESSQSQAAHSKNAPVTVTEPGHGQDGGEEDGGGTTGDQVDTQEKGFLAYFKTKEFYITLVLGYAHHSKYTPYTI